MTVIHYSDRYTAKDYGVDTREKAADIAARLATDPVPGIELRAPEPATASDLREVHSRRYIEALLTGRPDHVADQNGLGPWSPDLRESVLATTGGVVAAAREARATGRNSGSLSSGLHHAKFDHGSGFCTVNGLVVAAKVLIREGVRRVLILDLDAHCGGGTASLIDGVEGIEQVDVSVNRFDSYSGIDNARLVVTDGAEYLEVIERELDAIESPETIEVLLYNAGMDPHERCSTGGAPGVTTEVLARREQMVFDWAAAHGIPVAFVLAGGYSGRELSRSELVDLHMLTIVEAARPR